jgi:hypothetical protein
MSETKLARLRNLMSPVTNLYSMCKREAPKDKELEWAELIDKETHNCMKNIDEIKTILHELPDPELLQSEIT